jgi:hypothetical protein
MSIDATGLRVYGQQLPVGREQADERPRRRAKTGFAGVNRDLVVGGSQSRGEKMNGGLGVERLAGER